MLYRLIWWSPALKHKSDWLLLTLQPISCYRIISLFVLIQHLYRGTTGSLHFLTALLARCFVNHRWVAPLLSKYSRQPGLPRLCSCWFSETTISPVWLSARQKLQDKFCSGDLSHTEWSNHIFSVRNKTFSINLLCWLLTERSVNSGLSLTGVQNNKAIIDSFPRGTVIYQVTFHGCCG